MQYVVAGAKDADHRPALVEGEAAALDAIDDYLASGFRIASVVQEDGEQIDPMVLLERLQASERAKS